MGQKYVYRAAVPAREPGEEVTWADLLAHLLDAKRNRTPKYIYDLKNSLTRAHQGLAEIGVTRPHMVTRRAVKAYLAHYKAQGVSDSSVNHMAQYLMTEFTHAYQEEIFSSDKLATLQKIEITDKVKHVPVKMDEINAIVGAIYDAWTPECAPASRFRSARAREFFRVRDVCMTLFLPETGCRVGEMCRTLSSDLNLEDRTALFRNTKNGDDRLGFYGVPYRDGIFAEWLTLRAEIETLTDHLFITETGLQINPYTWGRQWDKYRQAAGIERRIRRHDLRHFASSSLDLVDKEASKEMVGHLTDSAHDIYSHMTPAKITALRSVHDAANPIGPVLVAVKARSAATLAAAAAEPKTVTHKVYTKK